jgi:hypothetical protein
MDSNNARLLASTIGDLQCSNCHSKFPRDSISSTEQFNGANAVNPPAGVFTVCANCAAIPIDEGDQVSWFRPAAIGLLPAPARKRVCHFIGESCMENVNRDVDLSAVGALAHRAALESVINRRGPPGYRREDARQEALADCATCHGHVLRALGADRAPPQSLIQYYKFPALREPLCHHTQEACYVIYLYLCMYSIPRPAAGYSGYMRLHTSAQPFLNLSAKIFREGQFIKAHVTMGSLNKSGKTVGYNFGVCARECVTPPAMRRRGYI